MLTKAQSLALLADYFGKVARIRAFSEICSKTLGTAPESPIDTHLHLLIDPMGECVEQLITGNEKGGWIAWYIWENDSGKSGMEGGKDGVMRPIRTIEDLYWVMCEV